jgi:L-asparaginase
MLAPGPRPRLPALRFSGPCEVAQVPLGLGETGKVLDALPALGYRGAVLEGVGAGHVPAGCVDRISRLAQTMPVVLCTRVPAGPTFRATYGFAGSETDLLAKGVVPSGGLRANQARLLLAMLLAAGLPRSRVESVFREWS